MIRTWCALKFLIKGPIILAFLVLVNAVTSPRHGWIQWAALGIGIAWVFSLVRVLRMMILLGGLAALIAYIQNRQRPTPRYPNDLPAEK